jgi:hypothetical protein
MKTAATYYSNLKNRELAKSAKYNRLLRLGKMPDTFQIKEGRLSGWVCTSQEPDECRTSHDVAPRAVQHTGWFVNSFEDETAYGIVISVRIPRKRAGLDKVAADESGTFTRVRFVEGVRDSWGNCFLSRKSSDLHDDERDAAASADSEAESHAEECREGDAKYQAEREIEEAREEIKSTRAEVLAILHERKTINQTNLFEDRTFRREVSAVCRAIRSQVSALLARVSKLRARVETLEGNYWAAVERC